MINKLTLCYYIFYKLYEFIFNILKNKFLISKLKNIYFINFFV